jgi:hypothetical protein
VLVGADYIIAEVMNNGTSWNPFSLAAETNIWFYLEDIHLIAFSVDVFLYSFNNLVCFHIAYHC